MRAPDERTVRAMHRDSSLAATVLLVCALTGSPSSASACVAARGTHVVLASQAMDPDVFVWDSMLRLSNYTAGKYVTNDVLRHTLLVAAGTEAVVVTCRDRVAHPRFSTTDADAVGVKLSTGRYRGRYGWVISMDLRVASRSAALIRRP
jgi:hypothetical protein